MRTLDSRQQEKENKNMRTQTIKVKQKNGRPVLYGSGNSFQWEINDGITIEGKMNPTFSYKLVRFVKRLFQDMVDQICKTITIDSVHEE